MAHTVAHGRTRAAHTGKNITQTPYSKLYITLHTVNTGNIKKYI